MMSAHSTVDIAVEAMKHGAIDFLVKPFPFQALDAAVERALTTARTRRQIAGAHRRSGGAAPRRLAALVGRSAAMEQVRTMVSRLAGERRHHRAHRGGERRRQGGGGPRHPLLERAAPSAPSCR